MDSNDDQLIGNKSNDTERKSFECDVCNRKFWRHSDMRKHLGHHASGFQTQRPLLVHFQDEHVKPCACAGGSNDMVKVCPLCSDTYDSLRAMRVHLSSRHGIYLDNPVPKSSSLLCSVGTPNSCATSNREYSELTQPVAFDKENIPSNSLVPQIEISSNSPYSPHFLFNAGTYSYNQDDRLGGNQSPTPPQNISPQSDPSYSKLPSSTTNLPVVNVMKETSLKRSLSGEPKSKKSSEINDDIQDMPVDLSSKNSSSCRRSHSPKCSSSKLLKMSLMKKPLRDKCGSKETPQGNGTNGTTASSRERSDSSSGHSSNSNFHTQAYNGVAITSSNGPENGAHSLHGQYRSTIRIRIPSYQCVYCGAIFTDRTLYCIHNVHNKCNSK